MLLALNEYIHRERMVSSQQLTRIFELDEQALAPMLAILMTKGLIQLCDDESTGCRGRCVSCKPDRPQYFMAVK